MKNKKYVITISRQFGSLGRPIAKKMSELLNIEYYDRDLVDEAAKKLQLPESVISEEEENATVKIPFYLRRMIFPLGKNTNSKQDEIFNAQQNIIKFLADRESCIIVGRCSDFILSEEENALHIYIYASFEERVKNCIKKLGLSEYEAKKMIVEVDEARKAYHMNYAGYLPDDKNHKDILIDSSILGIDGTAEYLVELVKRKFDLL